MQDWDMKKKQDFVHAMGKGHKKLEFVHKMAKLGLQHFDAGGPVLSGPTTGGVNQNATNPNTGILGTINGALGLNNNYEAGAASLQDGTNAGQLNDAYNNVQTGLGYQEGLANTLNPQAAIAVQNQNQLANQLSNEAQGLGPNVATNELNQATGENVSNQAALMAGQRGASSNVGLIARQAAQQGAKTQQDAVGQAATLQAQQQIAAQQGLAGLSANQISQTGQAGTNLTGANLGEQNILQNANTANNNANVSMQGNVNNTNAQASSSNQNAASSMFGGITSAASALSGLLAKGGEVTKEMVAKHAVGGEIKDGYMKKFAGGGIVGNPLLSTAPAQAPQSFVGKYLTDPSPSQGPNVGQNSALPSYQDPGYLKGVSGSGQPDGPNVMTSGPQLGSTEGDYSTLTSDSAAAAEGDLSTLYAKGGKVKNMQARGGKVKADSKSEKAVAPDDSYSNDKIPAMLSEGEIVLPREITMHKMAPEKAAAFVRRIKAQKKIKKGSK